ncbi:MAG: 30S ribosomal protein S8 [Planctomycetes bacterium]|nr:30S ribosomal protein S8 [Planctomycetota bacterium]
MASSDPVGDMIAMIKNANQRKHARVAIPHSRFKEGVARVLKEEGYVADYKTVGDEKRPERKTLWVYLKFDPEGQRVITNILRMSKPGRRVFRGVDRLGRVLDGLGIVVLSTHRGLLSDRQARKEKVGGEMVCKVW